MTVEIRPYGDRCNLRCQYCYENPLRDHGLPENPPDYKKIKQALKQHDSSFTVFGGEPLIIPIKELEEIFKFGKENWNKNGIQTNGTLITDKHIYLFEKYNVNIGFSIDGPGKLNDARRVPSQGLAATRAMTERSLQALARCMGTGIRCSIICTLSSMNIDDRKYVGLFDWFLQLGKKGLKSVRLHLLEEDENSELIPDSDSLDQALSALYSLHLRGPVKFDIFDEIEDKLRGKQEGCCIYQGCDPMNTQAVKGVGAEGEPTNCGRSNKEGVDFLKADKPTQMRDWILMNTAQEHNGCEDCKYWYACRGNCPGTGIGGDWRNRTTHCEHLKFIFYMILNYKKFELLDSKEVCKLRTADGHGDSHGDHDNSRPHGDHTDGVIELPRLEVRNA